MQSRTASPGRGRAGKQTPPVNLASRPGSQDRSRPASQTRASGTDIEKLEARIPGSQGTRKGHQPRSFSPATRTIWFKELPVYVSSDSLKLLTLDLVLKFLGQHREYRNEQDLDSVQATLEAFQARYSLEHPFNSKKVQQQHKWAMSGPKDTRDNHLYQHVLNQCAYIPQKATIDSLKKASDRRLDVEIQISDYQRRTTGLVGGYTETRWELKVRDKTGGIGFMSWQRWRSGGNPVSHMDMDILRQDFPRISSTDKSEAKRSVENLLLNGTIRVYRRVSANGSCGFVYVLDWDSPTPERGRAAVSPHRAGAEQRAPSHGRPSHSTSPPPKRQDARPSPQLTNRPPFGGYVDSGTQTILSGPVISANRAPTGGTDSRSRSRSHSRGRSEVVRR